jgi:hypothetical protein
MMDVSAADNAALDSKAIELDQAREQSTKWLVYCECDRNSRRCRIWQIC